MSGYLSYRGYCRGGSDKGFTLVELMITIAILAIIASIAIPSYSSFIERSTVRTTHQTFNDALKFASESSRLYGKTMMIETNVPGGTNWSSGFSIWSDDNGNGVKDLIEEVRYQEPLSSSIKAITENAVVVRQLVFNSDGVLGNDESIIFDICPTRLTDKINGVEITLLPTGMISVTKRGLCTGGNL